MAGEGSMVLNGKYLQDAEWLLESGDYPQASEKLWGAVAEMVKAVAAARGWRHFSHRELRNAVQQLANETADADLRRLFNSAEALHANFYENWMDADSVKNVCRRCPPPHREAARASDMTLTRLTRS